MSDAAFEAARDLAREDGYNYDVEWKNKRCIAEYEECVVCGGHSTTGFHRVTWKLLKGNKASPSTIDDIDGYDKEFVCSHDCKRKLQVKDAL